jgi:hypothetical protein
MNHNQFRSMVEMTEAGFWLDYCFRHPNPVLKEVGWYLSALYEIDPPACEAPNANQKRLDVDALTPLEILEALTWKKYLESHSLHGLHTAAEWIIEWMGLGSDCDQF